MPQTTAEVRRKQTQEDISQAIQNASERQASTHSGLDSINQDLIRLRGLHYLAERTNDYGLQLSVSDAELIVNYTDNPERNAS